MDLLGSANYWESHPLHHQEGSWESITATTGGRSRIAPRTRNGAHEWRGDSCDRSQFVSDLLSARQQESRACCRTKYVECRPACRNGFAHRYLAASARGLPGDTRTKCGCPWRQKSLRVTIQRRQARSLDRSLDWSGALPASARKCW